jgi:hypothetical protein
MDIELAEITLRRSQEGDPRSMILLFDRANLYDLRSRRGSNKLSLLTKTLDLCLAFLRQANLPIEEFPEMDREFITRDREEYATNELICNITRLIEKCVGKIDEEVRGDYAVLE